MKIAIVTTVSPFVFGGAEFVVNDMIQKLSSREGIEVCHFTIPFPVDFSGELIKFTLAVQSLRLDDYDMLIAFKYPAYCIPHHNKVVWLFHQFRQVYELWGTPFGFKPTADNLVLKDFVKETDDKAFAGARKVFSLSQEVANRLKSHNGFSTEIIYAPLKDDDMYTQGEYGDYIFYPSRISSVKRQHLAIEAMAYTSTPVKLKIAGKCAEQDYQKKIEGIIHSHSLKNKVELLGEISQKDKFNFFAKSLAAVFVPYKEDYGLVTLEAGHSFKPVVTTTDAGGVVELVKDNENGLVIDPDPKALAKAFDRLFLDRKLASRLGQTAHQFVRTLDLNWDKIIDRILK